MKSSKENVNVWDPSVPIEVSSYVALDKEKIEVFNEDNFKLENKPTMIDLFSGAGGFSVGCQWAGFQSVLGTDYLEPALNTWKENHPHALSVLGDIREIEPTFLSNLLHNKGVNKINLITGGVPCQGFSRSNRKHNDDDARNFLFLDYMKMVDEFKPDYIVLENVSGMQTTAGGKFVEEILSYMDALGYNAKVQLLNAAEFGVPQIRKRIVFVGVRRNADGSKSTPEYKYPIGEFKQPLPEGNLLGLSEEKLYRTVYDAISDLPELKSHESANEYSRDPITKYQKLMRGFDTTLEKSRCDILSNHVAPKHDQATIEKIRNTKPGEPMYEKFKQRIRLKYSNPSPTQLAGGIRPQFQFGHPSQDRGLTIRERARIQSFPDSYIFYGGTVQERVQTGNAIPPLLAYNVAKEIYKML